MGLCATCWAHFMCHHELWPSSVSHPFSSLNRYLGLTGAKHYQKLTTIPIFRLALQNYAFLCHFTCILFLGGWGCEFLMVGTIGKEEQYLISFKYWPIWYTIWADRNYIWGSAILADSHLFSVNNILAGLWLNCISFLEITLFLLADIIAAWGLVSVLGFI